MDLVWGFLAVCVFILIGAVAIVAVGRAFVGLDEQDEPEDGLLPLDPDDPLLTPEEWEALQSEQEWLDDDENDEQ